MAALEHGEREQKEGVRVHSGTFTHEPGENL